MMTNVEPDTERNQTVSGRIVSVPTNPPCRVCAGLPRRGDEHPLGTTWECDTCHRRWTLEREGWTGESERSRRGRLGTG